MATRLPLILALAILLLGGAFLLNRANTQARDTIRKHHLEDIEQALYAAQNTHGAFPPYDQPSWCGILSAPGNEDVLSQVEDALRTQNKKYANPAKPFPQDPVPRSRRGRDFAGYFYWKRNPATFELYSVLETDPTGDRSTAGCDNSQLIYYDYGITSIWRQNY